MKKLILLPLLSVIIFAGCRPQQPADQPNNSANGTSEVSQLDMLTEAGEIASAMASGQALNCVVTDLSNQQSFNYTVQGDQFRAENVMYGEESETTGEMGNILSTGEYFYTWTTPSNEGVKMKIPSQTEMQERFGQIPDLEDPATIEEYKQNYSLSCTPTDVPGNFFTPPADVEFQDMTAMMDKMMENADQMLTPEQQQMIKDAMNQQ